MPYISVTALSHPGLRREHNEDSLVVGPWTLCGTVTENPQTMAFPLGRPLVVAVADGIGGQPAGEVASSLVVRRLGLFGPALDGEEAVRDALGMCNHAVYAAADRAPELSTMGTTVAGVVILEQELLVFNVGDSRVIEVGPAGNGDGGRAASDDTLHQLSVDDSPALPRGRRTTSIVTQALGGAPTFSAITPHVSTSPLTPGTRMLVCSDGLTDPVLDNEIDDILRAHDGGRAVFELWKAAMSAGGPDNVTIALVSVAG
ncbi:PP2C family protein-serine/threonine phosphatase [Streptomyces sp. NPDC055059]|jgi:serine/threonine protein phosphatase PrpC|uniref:Serine/threonine-protein phosphatase n=1 Tax=Streptomyces sp. NBC_00119 TaxID=2975659 RepID=A0AAU1UK01_9ACTN|nr:MULTISPECIES: PP2C family serine/threonine-protein phosphatase [unclassified Streptomyces]MCX4650125.1 serine/threonine-protein phosphatase [Streptomyces sp. NBC_01446]MCX5320656.1 serine/threonine-protein phosphatase [Streptomyces sp. NBC_00120]